MLNGETTWTKPLALATGMNVRNTSKREFRRTNELNILLRNNDNASSGSVTSSQDLVIVTHMTLNIRINSNSSNNSDNSSNPLSHLAECKSNDWLDLDSKSPSVPLEV